VTPKTATPATAGPFTPEHLRELELAQERSIKIRKAARVANFNGWTCAIIAVVSALITMFWFSFVGLIVTVALGAITYNEFRGRDGLLKFERSAATLLGWNQVGLLAMITLYCAWIIGKCLFGPLPISSDMQSVLKELDVDVSLVRYFYVAFYSLVIALSAVFQGLNAFYYFSRRKYLDAYVRDTPEWVRSVQRATAVR
jgi:hypothetical protein